MKTKQDLLYEIEELKEKIEKLENDVDYWQKEYNDMEEIKDDLECKLDDLEMKGGINDLSNFIWKLKVDGLYCDKLQDFINQYVKYYND